MSSLLGLHAKETEVELHLQGIKGFTNNFILLKYVSILVRRKKVFFIY